MITQFPVLSAGIANPLPTQYNPLLHWWWMFLSLGLSKNFLVGLLGLEQAVYFFFSVLYAMHQISFNQRRWMGDNDLLSHTENGGTSPNITGPGLECKPSMLSSSTEGWRQNSVFKPLWPLQHLATLTHCDSHLSHVCDKSDLKKGLSWLTVWGHSSSL